jgi:hypothetical protein
MPSVPTKALEVGSFEGRSALWMLENLLTHPDSTLTVVDTFAGSHEHVRNEKSWNISVSALEARFDANTARHRHKVIRLAEWAVHRRIR